MSSSKDSSYVASEMPLGLDRELERLRDQALISWPIEIRNLKSFGLRDNMSVLEVGSGPGFVTEQLVDLVPQGSVTALEIDPVLIEKARAYLGQTGKERWQIVEGNIMKMDFPDNSFDFAYARYLFQHLPDTVGAAREIMRVLKPGGKLVIFDVDDEICTFDPPPSPEVKPIDDRLTKHFREEQASKGGNRLIGRRLPHILRDAGFKNLGLEALALHNQLMDFGNVVPKFSREEGEDMIARGQINEQELELMLEDSDRFYASDPAILIITLMASGEKP